MGRRAWYPPLIVFISNACVMIVELVAGRILAPRIGVSLYTWTSIIGVCLAGISAGNFIGGALADRHASRRLLGSLFLGCAVLTLAIIPLSRVSGGVMGWTALPLVLRIILITSVSFFAPAVLLGTISPVIVKLSMDDLSTSGSTIGRIYAASALGSIVGTFLTGFVLISLIGVYQILVAVALGLTAMGLLLGERKRMQVALGATLVVMAAQQSITSEKAPLCTRETNYFCIRLVETELGGKTVKALQLDRMVHTIVNNDDPTRLEYPYERVQAAVVQRTAPADGAFASLILGGGGFAFPRYLETVYPRSAVTTVEIDPELVRVAREEGWLPPDSKGEIITQDARLYLQELAGDRRFNVVIGDVFNDYSVPYHLTTREFAAMVDRYLTPDGFYLVNMIDSKSSDWRFLRSYIATLQTVFPHVYVIPVDEDWRTKLRPPPTIEIIASRRPLDLTDLAISAEGLHQRPGRVLTDGEMADLMRGEAYVLTDRFAPTDTLLAPVFSAALR